MSIFIESLQRKSRGDVDAAAWFRNELAARVGHVREAGGDRVAPHTLRIIVNLDGFLSRVRFVGLLAARAKA